MVLSKVFIMVAYFRVGGWIFLLMMACKSNNNKTVTKKVLKQTPNKNIAPSIKKVAKKKKVTLIKDHITTGNAVSFFKAYGHKFPDTNVLIKTRLGNIKLKLYKNTPLHRASFVYLIKQGYFNRCCFHRVVPDFIIQGG